MVWVGYPQSNDIEMTSVHGTTVFGGTFPAEIWNSLYINGEVPCEEFAEPETPVSWAPYFGQFTQAGGSSDDYYSDEEESDEGEESEAEKKGKEATGGYDPDAYAPGAGQEPTPTPEPAPTPAPAPSGGGGGGSAGGVAAG